MTDLEHKFQKPDQDYAIATRECLESLMSIVALILLTLKLTHLVHCM